jgi:predicted RNA-binding protein (virulence factor B family)
MQADRAYNGSAKYVKHQKLDQSASLLFLLTPPNGEILTFCDTTNPGQIPKSFSSYGLYGNALATGIDAPPDPKVSSIRTGS